MGKTEQTFDDWLDDMTEIERNVLLNHIWNKYFKRFEGRYSGPAPQGFNSLNKGYHSGPAPSSRTCSECGRSL